MTPESIGKYRVVSRIGRGGMGVVYRAHDPDLDRAVALKVIAVDVDVSDEIRARFFHEAQACARLVHPNIVTIYDLGKADDCLFIAMELLEGRELRQLIAEPGSLTLRDKLGIVVQLCDGLAYAHQNGIVHRDIKPANIFVQQNGHVKILDFGVARMGTDPGLTRTGLIVGTLRYAAPERLRGRGDDRSDIFAIGAVLYELLTGRPAFAGDDQIEILDQICSQDPPPPSALDPSLGPELDGVVMRALHKDPAQRFTSVRHLARELLNVQRRLIEAESASHRVDPTEDTVMFRPGQAGVDETVHFLDHARAVRASDPARRGSESDPSRPPNVSTAGTAVPSSIGGAMPAPVAASAERRDPPSPASRPSAIVDATPASMRDGGSSTSTATPASGPAIDAIDTKQDDVRIPDARTGQTGFTPVARDAADAAAVAPVETTWSAPAGHRAITPPRPASRVRSSLLRSPRTLALAAGVIAVVALAFGWNRLSGERADEVKRAEAALVSARSAALGADAATLASQALAAAEAQADAARRLVTDGRVPEALLSYGAATDAYGEATRQSERARAERAQADEARRAQPAAKEPPAVAAEPEAPKAVVPVVQAPPPVSPKPIDAQADVRATLDAYVKAIEKKDLIALRRVRPGLTDADLQRWAASFEIARTRKVELKIDDISVDGNAARATGRRRDTTVFTDGQRIQKSTRFVYTLSRAAKSWVLQTMTEVDDGSVPRTAQAERTSGR